MRIDKFLSVTKTASRTEAAKAAKQGRITVNGVPARDCSAHIDENADVICFDGQAVVYKQFVYIMMNKPSGILSASTDKKAQTVVDLLPYPYNSMGLFPCGRLDKDTVGLMILTNDGPTAHRLLSPKHHVKKSYRFECAEPLPIEAEVAFREGITLLDGYECKSAELTLDASRCSGTIVLTEGKYHQIKRMIASFSNKVTYLERISFGGIPLDTSLNRGEWRYFTEGEIARLLSEGH